MADKTTPRRVLLSAFLLSGIFAAPPTVAQQPNSEWSMAAPLPIARSEMKAANVNGKNISGRRRLG